MQDNTVDFSERIYGLASKIQELRAYVKTEEATKNSLILPFLQTLGYDTFDPRIVVPEFTSDIGTKNGEKVDFAIQRDGDPVMLIECKCCGAKLDAGKANQLHRYFQNTPSARIAILTDGVTYKFYSDLDKPNIMDEKAFMIFDFNKVEEPLIQELKKLANDRFDVETTLSAAQNLKYTRQIKTLLSDEFQSPSDEFVRIFASQVYSGQLRSNVVEDFRMRVKQALQDHINDVITERLKVAMSENSYSKPKADDTTEIEQEQPADENKGKPGVVTTDEEREAFFIVKSILREIIPPERIFIRDTKSYCGILLDDNNRKPLCRLRFDGGQNYIGTFDAEKNEARHAINSLDDIYSLAAEIKQAVGYYDEVGE